MPIGELAHHVVAYYWPQIRPYQNGKSLRQAYSNGKSIPQIIEKFVSSHPKLSSAESAKESGHLEYLNMIRRFELLLAQQPLAHFHTVAGRKTAFQENFLFDAQYFRKKMTRRELDQHRFVVLRPECAATLRHNAILLKSYLTSVWLADVRAMNKTQLDADDLSDFLFGATRANLLKTVTPLRLMQQNRCFYCSRELTGKVHVDHVIPWSRVPIDGLYNLVLSDQQCNLDKSASLPIRGHLDRALHRDGADLAIVAAASRLPLLHKRTMGAAMGIYRSLPDGFPLWSQARMFEPYQLADD